MDSESIHSSNMLILSIHLGLQRTPVAEDLQLPVTKIAANMLKDPVDETKSCN